MWPYPKQRLGAATRDPTKGADTHLLRVVGPLSVLSDTPEDGKMQDELGMVLAAALTAFHRRIVATGWRGREREAVSLFAFAELAAACRDDGPLFDPAQIGIEVAVPQLPGTGKQQVCKDLVIWPRPGMTCWDHDRVPSLAPSAIIEWKANGFPNAKSGSRNQSADRQWLSAWTRIHPTSLGFAAMLQFRDTGVSLKVDRVAAGRITDDWLHLRGGTSLNA